MIKPTFTFIILLFFLIGCKKNGTKPENPKKIITTRVSSKDSTIYEYARYLRGNDDSICPTILSQNVDSYHEVDTKKFNEMIVNFWGSKYNLTNVPYKKIDLKTIEATMTSDKCYDEYVGFECDSTKQNVEINVKRLDTFSLKEPCYSKPLFRTLKKKFNLTEVSIFEFTKAKNNNKFSVIFKVKESNGIDFYYDLTDWPAFIGLIKKNK